MSKILNYIANLLSSGTLERHQRQTISLQARLEEAENDLSEARKQLQHSQRQWEKSQTQLQQLQQNLEQSENQIESLKQKEQEVKVQLQQLQQKQIQTEQLKPKTWQELIPAKIEILEVKQSYLKETNLLWGFGIASPRSQTEVTGGAIIINGWVIGKKAPVAKVRITYQDSILEETAARLPRPGIGKKYPKLKEAGKSGFMTSISLAGMPSEAKLQIQGIFEDDSEVPLVEIYLRQPK